LRVASATRCCDISGRCSYFSAACCLRWTGHVGTA
jgi:hypothetical protein